MTRGKLVACAVVLALVAPGLAGAGEVRLAIKDGRVTLVARDATLREILLEWERVGGTRIVNRDRVPATRLTLELPNATEEQALTTLLRSIAGYMASRRLDPAGGASAFSRIILLPVPATAAITTAAAPTPTAGSSASGTQAGPPFGRPGMQRRVLPDGRVVTVMDDSQRAGEPDEPDEAAPRQDGPPALMRPPFNAPPRQEQGQAGDDATPQTLQPGQVSPTTAASPVGPTVTVVTPGALPATKPGTASPPPIKPPGD
jgi:hypothetical protein